MELPLIDEENVRELIEHHVRLNREETLIYKPMGSWPSVCAFSIRMEGNYLIISKKRFAGVAEVELLLLCLRRAYEDMARDNASDTSQSDEAAPSTKTERERIIEELESMRVMGKTSQMTADEIAGNDKLDEIIERIRDMSEER